MNNAGLRTARDSLFDQLTGLMVRGLVSLIGLPINPASLRVAHRATKRIVDTARTRGRDLAYRDYLLVIGNEDPAPRLELNRFTDELWSGTLDKITEDAEVFDAGIVEEIAMSGDFWARDAVWGQRVDSSKNDPRVGRVARVDWNPPSCPFCTLLNSRGPTYATAESAMRTLHKGDECDLVFVPAGTEDSYPGRESTKAAEELYVRAVRDLPPGTPRNAESILKILKSYEPDRPPGRVKTNVTDAIQSAQGA